MNAWFPNWNTWYICHRHFDQPEIEMIVSRHWTRFGAVGEANRMQSTAIRMGYRHLYYPKQFIKPPFER